MHTYTIQTMLFHTSWLDASTDTGPNILYLQEQNGTP